MIILLRDSYSDTKATDDWERKKAAYHEASPVLPLPVLLPAASILGL